MKAIRNKNIFKVVVYALSILVIFAVLALIIPSSRNAIFQRYETLRTEARLTKTYEHKQKYNERGICAAIAPECGWCPDKGIINGEYCYWNGALYE